MTRSCPRRTATRPTSRSPPVAIAATGPSVSGWSARDPLAVPEVLRLRSVELHDREEPACHVGGARERCPDVDGVVLEVDGVLHRERADDGAPESGEVGADTEGRPDVACQRSDVGARRAGDDDVEVDHGHVGAVHRDDSVDAALHLEPIDGDATGLEGDLFTLPGEVVGTTAVDLDGADRGGHLVDRTAERRDGRLDRRVADGVRRGPERRDGVTVRVVRVRADTEADRGLVGLAEADEVRQEPGRGADADDAAGRSPSGRACRRGRLLQVQAAPGDRDHAVARDALRLVDEEDAAVGVTSTGRD